DHSPAPFARPLPEIGQIDTPGRRFNVPGRRFRPTWSRSVDRGQLECKNLYCFRPLPTGSSFAGFHADRMEPAPKLWSFQRKVAVMEPRRARSVAEMTDHARQPITVKYEKRGSTAF